MIEDSEKTSLGKEMVVVSAQLKQDSKKKGPQRLHRRRTTHILLFRVGSLAVSKALTDSEITFPYMAPGSSYERLWTRGIVGYPRHYDMKTLFLCTAYLLPRKVILTENKWLKWPGLTLELMMGYLVLLHLIDLEERGTKGIVFLLPLHGMGNVE